MATQSVAQDFNELFNSPVKTPTTQTWKLTIMVQNVMTVHYLETPWNKNHGVMLDAVKALAKPILDEVEFVSPWTVGYRKWGRK